MKAPIERLHTLLETAEMIRDLGQKYQPLLRVIMQEVDEIHDAVVNLPDSKPKAIPSQGNLSYASDDEPTVDRR